VLAVRHMGGTVPFPEEHLMSGPRGSRRRATRRSIVALAAAGALALAGCGDDDDGGVGTTPETSRTTDPTTTTAPPPTTSTTTQVVEGRPWRAGRRRRARVVRARWAARWWRRPRPVLDGLDRPSRRALARAWARAGELEHASVAAFVELAAHLRAHGAPAPLVVACAYAADDERDHTARCFGLASRYAGRSVGEGRLDHVGAGPVPTVAQLAVESLVDGVVNEGYAALLASTRRHEAADPTVVAALTAIAADEAAHAELAWAVLAWCVAAGGDDVRAAVVAAGARLADPRPPRALIGITASVAAAHGFGSPAALAPAWADLRVGIAARLADLVARPVAVPSAS
jgi:hypothetical protein